MSAFKFPSESLWNFLSCICIINLTKWWLQLESNQRHQDFQSCALPTELWSQMAVPTGLEPAIPRVTGECDNHYTTEPFGCGRWIWTNDLWVMSPTSYQAALFRDIWNSLYLSYGGGKGIRTPAPISWPPGFQDRSLQPDLGIPPIIFKVGAPDRTWTDMSFYTRRILSPVRLPIPPLRHINWCLAGDSNPRPLD